MLAYFTWNPSREIFVLPYLHFPILWYSLLFALGFLFGYFVFLRLLLKYFWAFPKLTLKDVKSFYYLVKILKEPENQEQADYLSQNNLQAPFQKLLNGLDLKEYPLPKNGEEAALFLKQSDKEYLLTKFNQSCVSKEKRLFLDKHFSKAFYQMREKAVYIADKVTVYMVFATIAGARLGHVFFYEKPLFYLKNPWAIFKVWEGGLASHGAAAAILLALFILSRRIKSFTPKLSFLNLLDLIAVPTALAAVFIRIGNFFNQEISGTETVLPWGVLFLKPFDGSLPAVRHPVQLYEAAIYLMIFSLLGFLAFKKQLFLKKGKLIGLFLIMVFSFRFGIEFFKLNESPLTEQSFFLMGQYLSLPLILLGLFLFFYNFKKERNFT